MRPPPLLSLSSSPSLSPLAEADASPARSPSPDRKQKTILSYVITGWIAFLFTAISLVLVSVAARKTLKHGVDGKGPLAHEKEHTGSHGHAQDSAAASTVAESRPSVAHEKTADAVAADQRV